MTNPFLIADYQCHIGENPLWHPLEKRIYWTDITNGRLFRYDPAQNTHEQCYQGRPVGGFTIQANGDLLLFMEHGAIAKWRDGIMTYVVNEIAAERDFRFNDVIADPAGRVFCGTLSLDVGARPGRLYRLDPDGSLHLMLEDIIVSNGMAFTADRRTMFYTDSARRTIYAFDYDEGTGALSNQRVWLQTPEESGTPDGMTIDAQGCIWSARWDGAALYRYTPTGLEERRIEFPAKKVSSVTFGGEQWSDLYVTTALVGNPREVEGAGAGALFRLQLGIRGLPEYFSRILL
jgi:D-xylono/L-arabinono-1,4-lactonase